MFLPLPTKYSSCAIQLADSSTYWYVLLVGLEFCRVQRQAKLPSIKIILKMCVAWFYNLDKVTRDGSAV